MRLTLPAILVCIIAALQSCKETPVVYPEGGYEYPKKVEDSNHFFYPIRDSLKKKTIASNPYDFLIPFFNEPNLSLRPKPFETFRFFLFGFKQWPLIIVLTKNEIVVKHANTEEFFVKDTGRLTTLESMHYKILLDRYYQFYEYSKLLYSPKSRDSLLKLYPYIFDKKYRRYLDDKAVKIPNRHFTFTTYKKTISYSQYYKLVSTINKSGYWKFPIFLKPKEEYTDGFEYILEANTSKKYNFVSAGDINDEREFQKACQALIDAAGMGKEYQVYWKNEPKVSN